MECERGIKEVKGKEKTKGKGKRFVKRKGKNKR